MRIGVLSTSKQLNYGGILQAFALVSVLKRIRPETTVETINFNLSSNNEELLGETIPSLLRIWNRGCQKRLAIRFLFPLFMAKHRRRRKTTLRFWHECLCPGNRLFEFDSDLQNCREYDVILAGSDQIWNYSFIHFSTFLLEKCSARKVAYAASLGWKDIPDPQAGRFGHAVAEFSHISVREPSSIEILRRIPLLTNREIAYCVDPTILAGPDFWSSFENPKEDSGIVVYWLGDTASLDRLLDDLRRAGQKTTVLFSWYQTCLGGSIPTVRRIIRKHSHARWMIEASPIEFLQAIRNSQGVVSNSFHAMMFATIFRKNMSIVVPAESRFRNMENRILDFADRYGLHQAVQSGETFTGFASIDYQNTWNLLEKDRISSMKFLEDALKETP